jgi:glycosyltransferase involved in cell wall biosynthesis
MVKISIVCLIYRSSKLADWVYKSAYEFTPMLKSGEAEFLFVANDPTDNLLNHLLEKEYPFILNRNKAISEEELFHKGYGCPEYMSRVYKGYNQGILHAKGQRIVLINSDNYFSPDWLENLLKYSEYKNIVTSSLVEPGHPKFSFFPGAYHGSFGNHPDNFDKDGFLKFANKVRTTGIKSGGAYMPCLLYRDAAIYAGLYPEGNIAGKTFDEVIQYGDENFYEKLFKMGIKHITSKDSIVYHLKEGERDDVVDLEKLNFNKNIKNIPECGEYNLQVITNVLHSNVVLQPTSNHIEIMKKFYSKVSIILPFFNNIEKVLKTLRSAMEQSHRNIEILLINDCSTDDLAPLSDAISGDNRILMINIESRNGFSYCRNIGIQKCTGEYIAFLDSGDLFVENKVETQLSKMLESNAAISHTSYIKKRINGEEYVSSGIVGENSVSSVMTSCPIVTSTVMVKKEMLNNPILRFSIGLGDGEEMCLWLDLVNRNGLLGIDQALTITNADDDMDANYYWKQKNKTKNILTHILSNDEYSKNNELIYKLCDKFIDEKDDLEEIEVVSYCPNCVDLENSRSWKLTRPLRMGTTFIKSVKKYGTVITAKKVIWRIKHKLNK